MSIGMSYQSAHLHTSRYCECFAALEFCRDCNCQNCKNTPKFEEERQKAIKSIKERNPSAFKSKISTKNGRHLRGCHCKKSGCKKKSAHLLPDPQTSSFISLFHKHVHCTVSMLIIFFLLFTDTANVFKRVFYVEAVVNAPFVKTAVQLLMLSQLRVVPRPRWLWIQVCSYIQRMFFRPDPRAERDKNVSQDIVGEICDSETVFGTTCLALTMPRSRRKRVFRSWKVQLKTCLLVLSFS